MILYFTEWNSRNIVARIFVAPILLAKNTFNQYQAKRNLLVLKLGRRLSLRSKEAFFAGLAKGCRLTADYTKSDRERLNVTSESAVSPLQRSYKPSQQVRAATSCVPTPPPKEIQHWKHRF